MATTKISALPAATTADAADLTIVVTDIGAGALQDQKATVTQAATYSRALTGATTASAITGSGSSLIINTALADSDTRIAGTTSATLFFVDAGLDKVGIATAVPTQKLDVTGTVNATLFAGSGASITGVTGNATAFRTVATDPSPLVNGDVWYNSTSDTFKCALSSSGAWAAGGALPAGRANAAGCGASSTAALTCGGGAYLSTTYKYNGTAWSSSGAMITARTQHNASGTNSAAMAMMGDGGSDLSSAETFNGSTWSSATALPIARYSFGSSNASSTSIVVFCGYTTPSPNRHATAYLFNGSTWTATGTTLGAAKNSPSGTGTGTAAVLAGGSTGTDQSDCELFNGSTWASTGSLLTARQQGAAWGTTSDAMVCGGYNGGGLGTTTLFNGSTWTAATSLTTGGRNWPNSAGTTGSVSGLISGGTAAILSTEVYTGPVVTAKTFTVA